MAAIASGVSLLHLSSQSVTVSPFQFPWQGVSMLSVGQNQGFSQFDRFGPKFKPLRMGDKAVATKSGAAKVV